MTTIHECVFRLHVREAVSLLWLLDGTDQDQTRHAANYGCKNGDWTEWVNERVKNQLEKAHERNEKHGPFTPVPVDAACAERLLAAFPTGNVLFMGKHAPVTDGFQDIQKG